MTIVAIRKRISEINMPLVLLRNGTSISVQASSRHYSTPYGPETTVIKVGMVETTDYTTWSHVEMVHYGLVTLPDIADFHLPYDHPRMYGWLPAYYLDDIFKLNGGPASIGDVPFQFVRE